MTAQPPRSRVLNRPLTAALAAVLLASAFGVVPLVRPAVVFATAGPIAHWTFDEGSGTTATDSAGSNDGAFQGTPTWVTSDAAVGSGAISFAGTGDRVVVPNGPALEPTSITISAWIRSTAWTSDKWRTILQKGANGCEGGSWGLQGQANGTTVGAVSARVETATPGNWVSFGSSDARLWDDAWHHVAFTYDDTAGVAALYVDGHRWEAPFVPLMYALPTATNLFIGASPVSGCAYDEEYSGLLDDLSIYDRALSAAEIDGFVQDVTTTTTLDVGPSPLYWGTVRNMEATVSPAPTLPANVLLYRVTGGAHDLIAGGWTYPVDGRAFLQLAPGFNFPDVGTDLYVAEFQGDGTYQPSVSEPETLQVVRYPTVTTLSVDFTTRLPGQPVTLTASVNEYTEGLVTFIDTAPDAEIVTLGSGYTTSDGHGSYVTSITASLLAVGDHKIKAKLARTDTAGASTSKTVTVRVRGKEPIVNIGVSGVPQTNHPQEISVTFGAPGLDNPPTPTGTITIRDGSVVVGTLPIADWIATFKSAPLTLGRHSFTAEYSGDSFYAAKTSDAFPLVITLDVVQASSAGPEVATFYPPKDGYRDSVRIVGDRQESIWVGLKFYSAGGVQVGHGALTRGTGPYSFAWSGRTSTGELLPAGEYKVVQRLKDGYGNEKVITSFVTLSTKRLVDHTVYVTKTGAALTSKGAAGTGSVTTSSGYAKVSAGSDGWAGAGWEFTLPSAVVYRSIAFQIQAKAHLSAPPTFIGMQDFTRCPLVVGEWSAGCFDLIDGIGNDTGSLAWYSTTGSVTDNRSGRTVRGMISQSFGTSYVYAARVKVTYAVLE